MHKRGELGTDGVSLRLLQGRIPGSGGKGLLDYLIYKKGLRLHLLNEWLGNHSTRPPPVLNAIRDTTESFEAYRTKVGYPSDPKKDLTWKCGWPDSADEFFNVLEGMLFSNEYDTVIKTHCKNRKGFEEACATTGLQELLDSVKEKLDAEKLASTSTGGGTVAAPDTTAEPVTNEESATGTDDHLMADIPSQLPEDKMTKITKFQQHAKRLVASCVKFDVEPLSETVLSQMIKDSWGWLLDLLSDSAWSC